MARLQLYNVLTIVLSLTLASDEPFFFKQQPEDAELREGEEARLHCIVAPLPAGVRYTWYRRDTFDGEQSVIEDKLEPLVGMESSIWYEKSVSRNSMGYYHCKVETDDYKIFSKTAYLKVKYFTKPQSAPVPVQRQMSNNQAKEYLECETLESSPILEVTWTKNDKPIASDVRFFVFPEDRTRPDGQLIPRGTLLIMNVEQDEDDGTYKCLTKDDVPVDGAAAKQIVLSIYEVTTTSGPNPIYSSPVLVYKSNALDDGNAYIQSGGEVTLICAGSGYPTPSYEWFDITNGQRSEIRSADSLQLEDQNRRLVSSNIVDNKDYSCELVNYNAKGKRMARPQQFYVNTITDVKDDKIDIVQAPNQINVIKPNRYVPFTLDCSVRKTLQTQILWLKNGEKIVWNARIKEDSVKNVNMSINLIFETPNESDLGVYQCVIFNSKIMKVETAYVTLETDSLSYKIASRGPKYEFLKGPFSVDKAEEECNARSGHLVSILSAAENEKVRKIVVANKAASIWIGLTREVPEPVGHWLWTQSGDISTAYSNWQDDKPDNKYDHQEYTIMLNTTGKWVDVSKDDKLPTVCKRYAVVCPSVDEFYDGRVRVKGWESVGATYEVGELVEVSCRFPRDESNLSVDKVTCGDDQKFTPDILDECPEVPNSSPRLSRNFSLLASSILLFLLSTSSL